MLGDACFEPEGQTTTMNWKYVGNGRGGYEKLTSMKYVGTGGGFDKEVHTSSWANAVSKCCAGFVLLLIVAAVMYFGFTVMSGPEAPAAPATRSALLMRTPAPTTGTAGVSFPAPAGQAEEFVYDCAEDGKVPTWTAERRFYCCGTFGFHCNDPLPGQGQPLVAAQTSATPVPPEAMLPQPLHVRQPQAPKPKPAPSPPSPQQRAPQPPTPPPPNPKWPAQHLNYNCKYGLSNWEAEWDVFKKEWCCKQIGIGCAVTAPLHDAASTSKPISPASTTQKSQATKGHLTANVTPEVPSTIPPMANPSTAPSTTTAPATEQPLTKKPSHEQPPRSQTRHVVATSTSTPVTQSSSAKGMLASSSTTQMPPTSAAVHIAKNLPFDPASVFDCKAGLSKWEKGWSILKKKWCCKTDKVACDPFDCDEDSSDWKSAWMPAKKEWCCSNRKVGCATTPGQATTVASATAPVTYACREGLAHWEQGWSQGKKDWCCAHEKLGCPEDAKQKAYDCKVGIANWKEDWSFDKRDYCCKREHFGCPTTTTLGA